MTPAARAADLFRAVGAKMYTGNVAILSHAWDAPYADARWLIVVRELLRLPGHLLELRRCPDGCLRRPECLQTRSRRSRSSWRPEGSRDRFSFIPFTSSTGEIYAALDVVTFPNQGGRSRPPGARVGDAREADCRGRIRERRRRPPARGDGILLEDRGPEGIAAALRRLVLDPDLRLQMGRAGAQHARTAFNPALNARKVEALYRRVAAGSPDPEAVAGDA